jgi:hypothetical protein
VVRARDHRAEIAGGGSEEHRNAITALMKGDNW